MLAAAGSSCLAHPLNGNAITWAPPVASRKVLSVDWWQPLLTSPPLLEFVPQEHASPAVDEQGEQVIAMTRDGQVHAVRFGGALAWTFQTQGRPTAGAVVEDGLVYVPGGDGTLYALDASTGQERWRYSAGEELVTVPTIAQDLVMVASQTDSVFALERGTGKWVWQYRRDPPSGFSIRGASGVSVQGDTVFVGFSDGHLVALGRANGQVKWDRALSPGGQFGDVDATPILMDGVLYTASYREGVFALDPATGEVRWQSKVPGLTHIAARRGVLFCTGDERVEARLADNGRLIWTLPLKETAARPSALVNQFLAVPTSRELLFVDLASGRRVLGWDPGRGVTAPPVWKGDRLFVLSNLGGVFALDVPRAR
jgi:outer membrane protein assembly factor BamB